MSRPEITGLKTLVQACENELGCALPEGKTASEAEWQRRMTSIIKIKARARKDPRLEDIDTLVLCLDYCLAHDIWPKEPVGITYVIDEALDAKVKEERDRVDDYLSEAIAEERERGDLFSEDWISKLSRVQGSARHEVLAEWRRARGHG